MLGSPQDAREIFLFLLTEGILVGGIPWGFYVRWQFLKRTHFARQNILLAHASAAGLGIAIVATRWSFTGIVLDWLFLSLALVGYCGLVFLLSVIPPRKFTWLLTVLGSLPLVFALLGSPLGLVFIMGDEMPHQEGSLTRNYSYRINWYGNATAKNDWAEVKLFYQPWPVLFVEHEVFKRRYMDVDCDFERIKIEMAPDQKRIFIDCPGAKQVEIHLP